VVNLTSIQFTSNAGRKRHAHLSMLSTPGMLTDDMKARVAAATTNAHVEATGAPRVFVHVFFRELPPGTHYSAGEIDNNLRYHRSDPRRTPARRQTEADQADLRILSPEPTMLR
jgi:phenylpyruvate tautomerase PptA (4-oxalocrotonate tautomerase family)